MTTPGGATPWRATPAARVATGLLRRARTAARRTGRASVPALPPEPDPRQLVLHIGMGKTGTTALQGALIRNRQRLADLGVHYPDHPTDPVAEAYGLTGGNGATIANLLGSEFFGEVTPLPEARSGFKELCSQVAKHDSATVLYSSELIYRFDPDRLAVLVRQARRARIELRVALYVRDIAPYFLSAYSERVKRSGYPGSFDEYLAGGDDFPRRIGLFRPRLTRLVEILGRDRVQVLHYDSARDNLFPVFVRDVLGLPKSGGWELPPTTVNRGLSDREVAYLRYLNRSLAQKSCPPWDGQQLVGTVGACECPQGVSAAALGVLEELFAADVSWINGEFLDGRLSLAGNARLIERDEPPAKVSADGTVLLDRLAQLVCDGAGPRHSSDQDQVIAELRMSLAAP